MGSFFTGKKLKAAAVVIVFSGILGLFLLVGPPRLLEKSDSPEFCAMCHVMEAEHTAFMHAGAHRRKKCADCHIPNNNKFSYYLWKSIYGMNDLLVFNSGRVPDPIRLSERGAKMVRDNCIRCHGTLVANMDTSRNCWECHRRISHAGVGSIETR
jgi:cytochrome c nitrite reductase small subunit